MANLQEADEALNALLKEQGVNAYIVANHDGIPVKTAGKSKYTSQRFVQNCAGEVTEFIDMCKKLLRNVDIQPEELDSFRIRSKTEEMIITPGGKINLIVFQENEGKKEEQESKEGEAEAEK